MSGHSGGNVRDSRGRRPPKGDTPKGPVGGGLYDTSSGREE